MSSKLLRGFVEVDEPFIIQLLEGYIKKVKYPIGLYSKADNKLIIPRNKGFQQYCTEVQKNKKLLELCNKDHMNRSIRIKKRGEFGLCHAGLHNFSFPIYFQGKHIATVLTGQIIIKERKEKSNERFNNFIIKNNISGDLKTRLIDSYNCVPEIKEEEFNNQIVEYIYQINTIITYLLTKEANILRERNETVRLLLHDITLHCQAIVAFAENVCEAETRYHIKQRGKFLIREAIMLSTIIENIRSALSGEYKESYDFSEQNIVTIIEESIEMFREYARTKNLEFKFKKPVYVKKIEISPPHFTIIMKNLIHNAIKYSYSRQDSEKGHIDISLDFDNDEKNITIEVSNFGTGILAEEISNNKLLKMGQRGKLSIDKHRLGSGLGLYNINKIVEAHNGSIEIDSHPTTTQSEKGPYLTKIKVTLPCSHTKGGTDDETL